MKTLKDINLKNKLVVLRSDLNSDTKGKKVLMSQRIIEAAKTISYLKNKKAKVVIIAHQGNPGKKDFISLNQHNTLLNKFTKIKFVSDTIGKKSTEAVKKLKEGDAILLENIRYLKEEFEPNNKNNKILKFFNKFDVYVNDSFSVCHRNHTSLTTIAKVTKESCAGLLLEKEITSLENISVDKALYILGGAKPESNIKLLKGKNKVLSCGLFGQTCVVAKGKSLGYQDEFLKKSTLTKGNYQVFLKDLKSKLKKVKMPVDFAIRNSKGKREEHKIKDFPLDYEIEDIGQKTIKKYIKQIKKAKAIYMKGPAGFTQEKQFATGTVEILKAIADSKGFSLIGGGHLNDAIDQYKIPRSKINHISLSGGALLNYIAGEKLIGLKSLGYYK